MNRKLSSETVILPSLANFLTTLLIYKLAINHMFFQQCVPKAFIAFFATVAIAWIIEVLPVEVEDTIIGWSLFLICLCSMLGRWLGSAWLTALYAGGSLTGVGLILVICSLIDEKSYWVGSKEYIYNIIEKYKSRKIAKAAEKAAKAQEEQQLKDKEAEMNFNRQLDL